MLKSNFTVYLVEDHDGALKGLKRFLSVLGLEAKCFSSAEAFLAHRNPSLPSCVILDAFLPEYDGLAVQEALANAGDGCPVIFLTSTSDVPTSVRAIKAGAVDFLIRPIQRDALLHALAEAQAIDSSGRQLRDEQMEIYSRLKRLTPRERQVLAHVVKGRLNKQIAGDLGTVEKTIKVHRGRVMQKMRVRHVADLVRLMERAAADSSYRPLSIAMPTAKGILEVRESEANLGAVMHQRCDLRSRDHRRSLDGGRIEAHR
jgi:FixJ family two-component response regulator